MDSIELRQSFPVSAETVYKAWLNSESHSSFTGGLAAIEDKEHSRFTAWDGYITGRILELDKGERILQSWRTTEFSDSDEDSMLEIFLQNTEDGCILILKQWDIPSGQGPQYKTGWQEHYFEPMMAYFNTN